MNLIPAQCPNCGGVLSVDNTKDAMICPYCNSAIVIDKAIQVFNNTYTITNNITAQNVIIQDSKRDDGFDIENGILKGYVGASEHVDIPEGVVVIQKMIETSGNVNNQRCSNKYIRTIHLSSTVKVVNFHGLPNLEKVYPLDNVKEVEENGFYMTNIKELDLANAEMIGTRFIAYCKELECLRVSKTACEKQMEQNLDLPSKGGSIFYKGWADYYELGLTSEGIYYVSYDKNNIGCPKLDKIYIDGEQLTPDSDNCKYIGLFVGSKLYEDIIKQWENKKCRFCGGDLKGIFTKECKKCGKKQK